MHTNQSDKPTCYLDIFSPTHRTDFMDSSHLSDYSLTGPLF